MVCTIFRETLIVYTYQETWVAEGHLLFYLMLLSVNSTVYPVIYIALLSFYFNVLEMF